MYDTSSSTGNVPESIEPKRSAPARAPRLPTYGPKMDAATLYVRLIQNPVKRAYAAAYALHLAGIEPVPEKPADLSYMAAQAVVVIDA